MFAEVDARHPLRAFLPRNLDTFYRYSGSLTTPTCNEVVTWTVFADAITISEKQVGFASGKGCRLRGYFVPFRLDTDVILSKKTNVYLIMCTISFGDRF